MATPPEEVSAGMTPREWKHLALVILIACFTLGWGISSRPLYHSDESRYAQIGWWMWESGDWIVPRLEGSPYIDKPPLFVWLIAGAIGLFGHGNLAPRLIPFLSSIAIVPMVYFFGRRAWSHSAGLWSAAVWATSGLALGLGRGVAPDMLLGACTTGSVYFFWRALETGRGAIYGWVLAALGFLTKGPVAFLVPALAGLGYWILHRRFSLRRVDFWAGLPVCFLILAPWAYATWEACPQFFERFFINQNLGGFKGEVHHPQPFWATAVYAFVGMAPWSILILPAAIRDRAFWKEPFVRFLLFWALAIVFFFTLSKAKLATYVIPAMPALALVCGALISRSTGGRWDAVPAFGLALAGAAGAVLVAIHPELKVAGLQIRIAPSAIAAGAVVMVGSVIGVILALRRRPRAGAIAAVATIAAVLIPGIHAIRDYGDVHRSSQFLIERNRGRLTGVPVILLKQRDYSVTYYLKRQAYHVGRPSEVEYGQDHVDPRNPYMLPDHGLRAFLTQHPRVGVVTSPSGAETLRSEFPELVEVDRAGKFILFVTPNLR